MTSLVVPARFNGPPGSGNGGYVCGVVAGVVEGVAEVTLRSPPPLETPMSVDEEDGVIRVRDGDTLVAEARSTTIELDVPAPPTIEQAAEARSRYVGLERHEFPTCFTCGTARDDGLAIHPGAVIGTGIVASDWVADDSLPSEGGILRPEVVWAALDCPGAWATMRETTSAPVVLGRMTAELLAPVRVGDRLVSYGWQVGAEGRKAFAGTAVADASGRALARARQTWIEVA